MERVSSGINKSESSSFPLGKDKRFQNKYCSQINLYSERNPSLYI